MTLSPPLQNPDTLCRQYSRSLQFSNSIKNGNEVSLAGNEVSLATDGETLNNVGINSVNNARHALQQAVQ